MALSTEGSRTAVQVALLRARHAENDEPKVFNDYLAGKLFTPGERADFEGMAVAQGMTVARAVARARFIEDHLLACIERGVSQYVILGAGFDTFAVRRADLQDRLTVFEIDHPATQESKRTRLAAARLAWPPNLHFLPADFERESLFDVLLRSPYRRDRAAFFSMAGVTYYLPSDTVLGVLRSIRRAAAPGSCLAFDYLDLDAFDPLKAAARIRVVMERVRRLGEPLVTGFDPQRLPSALATIGFHVVEALSPGEQLTRYFNGRADGLRPPEHVHLLLADLAEPQ
jgi:methyltransferase (TIGR00027 family)